jgi:hypothetical protein
MIVGMLFGHMSMGLCFGAGIWPVLIAALKRRNG